MAAADRAARTVRTGLGLTLPGLVLCFVMLAAGCADSRSAADPVSNLRAIILDQISRYPSMREPDVYKLLYQAARGPAHVGLDQQVARSWMERELLMLRARRAIVPLAGEPLVEEIDPHGDLVRVNLRPFLAAGGDPMSLADAFAQSAAEYVPSPARLEEYLAAADEIVGEAVGRLDAQILAELAAEKRAANYPAVHHSDEYEKIHIPAYRVVLRRLVPAIQQQ